MLLLGLHSLQDPAPPRRGDRRRDVLPANWDDEGQVQWLESAGVDLIRGQGRITWRADSRRRARRWCRHHLPGRHRLRATEARGWLYAVGDVNGRALFTHAGKYQARIAGLWIAGNPDTRAWGDEKALPRVIFTSPQIAAVGSSAQDAIGAGHDVHTVEYDTGSTAGASTLGEGYGGKARLVIDAADRTLIGATFVGPRVGAMLHAATIAIVGRVTLDQLWACDPLVPHHLGDLAPIPRAVSRRARPHVRVRHTPNPRWQ